MTAVLRRLKKSRELRKVLRVAELFVALDQAAGSARPSHAGRPRTTFGRA